MAKVTCPKCPDNGDVLIKESQADNGKNLKYFECHKCKTIWTNSIDVPNLPVQS